MGQSIARHSKLVTSLDAATATGAGTAISIGSFHHVLIEAGTASSANLTVKFAISLSKDAPDVTSAQSVANHWDYCQVYDLNDASTLDGDTGWVLSGTDDFKIFQLNADGAEWIIPHVTARSAGSVTVKIRAFSNQ